MKWNNRAQTSVQAKYDRVVNGETLRVAGVFPVDLIDGQFKIVEFEQASEQSILVAFFPGLVMTSPGGKPSLVPLNSELVRGKEGDKGEWVNGCWCALAEIPGVMGQKVLHFNFGKVGNWPDANGGFLCRPADLERGGAGTLEQLMFDAVQAVSAQVWAHGETFLPTDEVALQTAIATFSRFLGQPIRLDIKEEKRANEVLWVNSDGSRRQLESGSDVRRAAYQAKRENAGTTRAVASTTTLAGIQSRLNIGAGRIQTDDESGTGTGTRG